MWGTKMKSFPLVSLVMIASVLAACNSGGSRKITGRQCPAVYDPIPFKDIPANQKLWKKDSGNSDEIPKGTYAYNRADMLYVDSATGLVIHMTDAAQKGGTFTGVVTCLRNGDKLNDSVKAEDLSTNNIVTQANGKPKVDIKKLSLKVEAQRLKVETASVSTNQDGLEKVYEGKAVEDYFLVKVTENIYELRSQRKEGSVTITTASRFIFTKAP